MYTKKIGVLGGSFNPPTTGHMQMAIEVINLGYVDEVWIVPCGDRNDKVIEVNRFQRLEMVKLIVEEFFPEDFPIKVIEKEIENGTSIPTYKLMKNFIEENPENEFFFLLGSDLLFSLKKWDFGENLVKEINFIIFCRVGYKIDEAKLPHNYVLINTSFVASSSSEVRKRVKENSKLLIDAEYNGKIHTGFKKRLSIGDIKIFSDESIIKRRITDDFKELKKKYLGVYGIVPFSIIQYIASNRFYLK